MTRSVPGDKTANWLPNRPRISCGCFWRPIRSRWSSHTMISAHDNREAAATAMQLSDLSWPALQALPRDTPVVFPVAALEQHGGHLPLFTDSLLLGEIVYRAAATLGRRVL